MENNTTQTEAGIVHIFERAGLGKAPFCYVGEIHQDIAYGEVVLNRAEWNATGIRMTTKPGGTCDYCGAFILNMFRIKSADGKTFKVGSDCVMKTGDAGLKKVIDAVVKANNSRRRLELAADKLRTLRTQMNTPEIRAQLREQPHPKGFRGKTLCNYVAWMMDNGGMAGKLKVAKIVASVVAGTYVDKRQEDEEQRCEVNGSATP